jgi:RNA recognition motif-containing protein
VSVLPAVSSLLQGEAPKGSYHDGDPTTTNLYIGHLGPAVTEEHLFDLFGRYGEINSVKGRYYCSLKADAEDGCGRMLVGNCPFDTHTLLRSILWSFLCLRFLRYICFSHVCLLVSPPSQ